MGRRPAGVAPRPESHRLWGSPGRRAEDERDANHSPGSPTTARPCSSNGQSEAGGRATRRHSNQLDLLLLPAPPEKQGGSGNETRASHCAKPTLIRLSSQ